ncbi:MAG: hypothetical protein ACLPKB_05880 [Xanthobacteraceae bacterium]
MDDTRALAADVTEIVIDAVIDALREDERKISRRTRHGWELYFGYVRESCYDAVEDRIAQELVDNHYHDPDDAGTDRDDDDDEILDHG